MPDHAATSKSTPGAMAFAAGVYVPRKTVRRALSQFVRKLASSGVCVAGILQEESLGPDGIGKRIDAIDITTGHRIPIKRPMKNDHDCGLDVSALAETTAILRKAINSHPDLVVIEKFGDRERAGKGLSHEIFEIIATGIPLLIAVPESTFDIWQQRSGGLGAKLPFEEKAFHEWWFSVSGQ